MFRLSKLSAILILFFLLTAVPVYAKVETNPGISYCDCCAIPLVPWTGYGCTSHNHSGQIHIHSTLNVSCYNVTSGLHQSTAQILDTHCEYGCDNATGVCNDPTISNQYLFMVEIAFLSLIFVSLVLFAVPLPDIYGGIKAVSLVLIFLLETWLFVILNIYANEFGGLFGTMGGWVGSLSNLLTWVMYFMLALVVVYFLYVFMRSRQVKEEE